MVLEMGSGWNGWRGGMRSGSEWRGRRDDENRVGFARKTSETASGASLARVAMRDGDMSETFWAESTEGGVIRVGI